MTQETRRSTPHRQTEATAQHGVPAAPAGEPSTPPSLIETMRMEPGGLCPLLSLHLQRLRRSSAALGYPCPDEAILHARLRQATTGLDSAAWWRLRLLLAADGELSLETTTLSPPLTPLKVVIHGQRLSGADAWLQHKTTHRPWYEDAARWLTDHPDVFDVLYWNEAGDMCEGSRSNLYMQMPDGRWLTPPLSAGALPGVQRQALLQAGQVEVAPIRRDDFLHASAIRISNALRGWCDAIIHEPVRASV